MCCRPRCVRLACLPQTTILIDWLIGTSCYSAEVGRNYSEKKVESVQDKQKVTAPLVTRLTTNLLSDLLLGLLQCILRVSYVDEHDIWLVKKPKKKSLQDCKPLSVQPRKVNTLQRSLPLVPTMTSPPRRALALSVCS